MNIQGTSELENRSVEYTQVETGNATFEKYRVSISCLVYRFLPSTRSNARYVLVELIHYFRRKWTYL